MLIESEQASEALPRAALYARVSTGRQAEQDLSIPDQVAHLKAWCEARGFRIEAQYIEPGASATDDKRPEFQRMIERACDGEHAFDVIVVHSYSRFFRDAFGLEFYVRKLAKQGVKLVSITQELGEDPAQVMMRQVIALFDEYQSKENAKHVLRAMKENARQGFWNGARPPFGYRAVEVERRGARVKKKLAIEDVEAEMVRLVYRLFMEGDQQSGPMGVKGIAVWLNEHGILTRQGGSWGVSSVYKILTNPVYGGHARFNRLDTRKRRVKEEAEHIRTEVPCIIPHAEFEQIQSLLEARSPRVVAPRVITGPILLTGLAFCASCAGAMTLRTGTSRTGVVHRYYNCSTCGRQGKTACKGRSIRMDRLDNVVTERQVLHPERIAEMLSLLAGRRAERAAAVDERIARLEKEASAGQERLQRLYRLIEDGLAELDDLLRERIASLKAERERAVAALERARTASKPEVHISSALIERFTETMCEKLRFGEIPMRKAYLSSIVDRVEVDDGCVRIMGPKDAIEQGVRQAADTSKMVRSLIRQSSPNSTFRRNSRLNPPHIIFS